MEEKVKNIIKLIEVDADSFAKRAEMYYQRRPELVNFVEETYRAFKALADRYDRISGDMHKANHTLASAFPDQFQFAMQDEDEDGSPREFTAIDTSKHRKSPPVDVPQINLRSKSGDASSTLKMLKGSNKEGRSVPASPKHILKQDMLPLDKKLRELHTELQVWLEQNGLLKGELQFRFKTLCNIQEEISRASRDTESEDSKFTPYQAAKFQGQLFNMQQENNKVTKELQTGLDHVKAIQSEVAKALSKLRESFDLLGSKKGHQKYQNFRHLNTKSKVPLRTFLFGEKRKKPSFFSCMSPAPNKAT